MFLQSMILRFYYVKLRISRDTKTKLCGTFSNRSIPYQQDYDNHAKVERLHMFRLEIVV
jgi:hypothetical protein